ncbi:MAG: adenylate cyclase, partial [Blautia wexlerae]
LTIELDVFDAPYEGLYLAEVEFSSEEQALSYNPPVWFGEDVTNSGKYHNSRLSQGNL